MSTLASADASPRVRCAVLALLVLMLGEHARAGAQAPPDSPPNTADAYVILGLSSIDVSSAITIVTGSIGVNENGGKLQGNNSVGLNQIDGVIAATKVTLTQPSTCAALFAHSGSGSGQCATVEKLQPPQPPLVPDLEHSDVCVLPSPFPKCSSNAVTVNAGDVRMLAAGTYGDLTINGGSLVLQGGQYVFCNVNVNNGSVVVAGAPSTLLVTDRFNVEPDALVNATGSPTTFTCSSMDSE